MDEVNCAGTETTLFQCNSLPLGSHNCVHEEDAGVQCQGISQTVLCAHVCMYERAWSISLTHVFTSINDVYCYHHLVAPLLCDDGAVRLVSSSVDFEGRVEICIGNVWGTVCDDFWGAADAAVTCSQLGYNPAGQTNCNLVHASVCGFLLVLFNFLSFLIIGSTAYVSSHYGPGTGAIFLDDVQCNGTETALLDCTNNGIGSHNCGHLEDAGVRCLGKDEAIVVHT